MRHPGLYRLCYRWLLSGANSYSAALLAESEFPVRGGGERGRSFGESSAKDSTWGEPCYIGSSCSVELASGCSGRYAAVVAAPLCLVAYESRKKLSAEGPSPA